MFSVIPSFFLNSFLDLFIFPPFLSFLFLLYQSASEYFFICCFSLPLLGVFCCCYIQNVFQCFLLSVLHLLCILPFRLGLLSIFLHPLCLALGLLSFFLSSLFLDRFLLHSFFILFSADGVSLFFHFFLSSFPYAPLRTGYRPEGVWVLTVR